jgi:hypothetical protein
MKTVFTLILAILLDLAPRLTEAQFLVRETEDLRLVYLGKSQEYLVGYVAQTFENALQFHEKLFEYSPTEPVTVLMHDFSDYGNAGADAVPTNYIMVGIAPYSFVFETVPANERMNSTFNHELVHVVANDMATKGDRTWRTIFGGKVQTSSTNPETILYSYLTAPRRYSPRWYHEGIAVFLETWMAGGLGRSQGAYDEMAFRTLYLENARMYDVVGLESEGVKIDFQVGVNSYLYGTRFMGYLARQYGAESLIEWAARKPGSKGYFASQFKLVFGLELGDAWDQWLAWERDFQEANLTRIRKNETTAYRDLVPGALGSVSKVAYDTTTQTMYAGVNYRGAVPHIAALDLRTGKSRHLKDVKGAALYFVTSTAFDQESRTLFYTTDNNKWRDLVAIDLETGKSQTLLSDFRMGDLAFNPVDKSIWGVRHLNGFSSVIRVPHPYDRWERMITLDYGVDLYDLDVSPDGQHVSGARAEINGDQTLVLMDVDSLEAGRDVFEPLFRFGWSNPDNFTFSPDGRYLYGSSYYSGVSNIFRYDLENRRIEPMTNAETGFFRPVVLSDDSLFVLRYAAGGFTPAKIPNRPVSAVSRIEFLGQEIVDTSPMVRDWQVGSPAMIEIDSLTTYAGEYSGFANMEIVSAYPVVEGYKDYVGAGYRLNMASPLGLHTLSLTASVTPFTDTLDTDELFHGRVRYRHSGWTASGWYNNADFYDLFGPTKVSRKGYALGLQYDKTLIYDRPKRMNYSVWLRGYAGLEELPESQNITTPDDKSANAGFSLNYENERRSIGSVDSEKGVAASLVGSANLVRSKIFPRFYTTLDLGTPGLFRNASWWLRTAAGISTAAREEPYANFYFGGFGNNYVDHRSVKRYRDYYSFPGAEISEISGTNFVRVMGEWNLPAIRFRDIGGTSLFLEWFRPSLFATGLVTNIASDEYRSEVLSVGGQVDIRVVLLSYMPFTLSSGYAAVFQEGLDPRTEFMFSLKIL